MRTGLSLHAIASPAVGIKFAGKGFARARDRAAFWPRDSSFPNAETGTAAPACAIVAENRGSFRDHRKPDLRGTGWWRRQSESNPVCAPNSLITGKLTGKIRKFGPIDGFRASFRKKIQQLKVKFPVQRNREFFCANREISFTNRDLRLDVSKRPFLATLVGGYRIAICSRQRFAGEEIKMTNGKRSRSYFGEAFWRAHHEAWRRSDLNQREYCEVEGISLKAFGNWRAKFKSELQPPARKLLYRRGGPSHTLSHSLYHGASHPPRTRNS